MRARFVILALSGAITAAHAAGTLSVTIGSAAPMSGPEASQGQDNTNGVRMAIDDLNAQHLSIAGHSVIWRVDAEDDQADPKQATTVAQKFVDEQVSGVVGHLNSGCTYPASRVYQRAGIPDITPSSTNPKIAKQGFSTFFRILANDDAIGAGLADYARTKLHARSVAVIDDRTSYGQGVADVFAARAAKDGMTVQDREYTTAMATDFSAILTKLKALHPDVIFYGGMYSQAGPMLRQIQQLGIKVQFMGGDGVCQPVLAKLAGDAADITTCAEGGAPIAQMPGGKAWLKRYAAKFGPNAFQVYSPYAYDATMVLAHAMARAGSADPAKYLRFIRNIDYDGVTKRDIHFQKDGNLADPVITISGFRGGVKTMLDVESVK